MILRRYGISIDDVLMWLWEEDLNLQPPDYEPLLVWRSLRFNAFLAFLG